MGERVALIDGTDTVARLFFALPADLRTRDGLHVNALFGLCQVFRALLGRPPTHGAIVLDHPPAQDRLPPALLEQLPWIAEVARAHDFAVLHAVERGGLGVIAAITADAVARGADVVIVGADKRLPQLVRDEPARVRVQDPIREVAIDPGWVRRRWNVDPVRLPELLALVGDGALDIPGVPGVGPKTAARLLADADLHEILADPTPDAARRRVQAHADLAREGVAVARIVAGEAVPLDTIRVRPPSPDALNALYRDLELHMLLAPERQATPEWFVCDTEEVARHAVRELDTDRPVAVQVLADGPAIVGVAVAVRPGRALYFPIAGPGPHLPDLALLAGWLADADRPKVLHDAKSAWVALGRGGLRLEGVVGDTQLASFLVDPAAWLPHELDQVARVYLGRAVQGRRGLLPDDQPLSGLPVGRAGAYACHLADTVAALWPVLERRLRVVGLLEHLRAHDLPLARIVAGMERDGIAVDTDRLRAAGQVFAELRDEVEREVHALVGPLNLGSPRQVGELLFERLGLPVLRRTATGYNTSSDVLERLVDKHPVVARILRWRHLGKMVHSGTDAFARAVDPATGRIHARFHLTSSHVGRILNTDPDLQRVPARSPEGRAIRRAFVADAGHQLIVADYSQLELRVFAHFTGDPALVDAFARGEDVHCQTAATVFDVDPADVTSEQREIGKAVNFATLYGQGPASLAVQLGISQADARAFIERFDRTHAAVRAWQARQLADAEARGWAVMLLGRRRPIPELSVGDPAIRAYGERLATNVPVQGSAVDVVRLAIRAVADRFAADGLAARLLLVVHDELVIEAPDGEVPATIAALRDAMARAWPLSVPFEARIGAARTWAR